jgi:hypothetical protein
MTRALLPLLAGLAAGWAAPAGATDANVPRPVAEIEAELANAPFTIVAAEISRPKAKGDITLKAELSFAGGPPYRVKLRRAEPGAEDFNNRPRYDAAAYRLQTLFLDPADYVVPPTALRFLPVGELLPYAPQARPTFRGSDEVMVVLQYWLQQVQVVADVYDPARYAADPGYARHVAQLNVFTYLIEHGDANVGNFLLSREPAAPRVFSVDNGVAFAFNESDRSDVWKQLRVDRLPAGTVGRLRQLTREDLDRTLGVLAEWKLVDGRWTAVAPGANLQPLRGVRVEGDTLQLGLTRMEVERIDRRRVQLLKLVDSGKVGTVAEGPP